MTEIIYTILPHKMAGGVQKMVVSVAAIAVFFMTGIVTTRAQVPALGPCPDIETMHDFNIQRVSRIILKVLYIDKLNSVTF
jgi:hypothetical protein